MANNNQTNYTTQHRILVDELNSLVNNSLYTAQFKMNNYSGDHMTRILHQVRDEHFNILLKEILLAAKKDLGDIEVTQDSYDRFSTIYKKSLYVLTPEKFKTILEKVNTFYAHKNS